LNRSAAPHHSYIVDDDVVSVCRALSCIVKVAWGSRSMTFTARGGLFFCVQDTFDCHRAWCVDIKLPDIHGLPFQDAMAARQLAIPIVFISGHGDIPMSVKGIKAGAVDFLPKPFTKKKLLSAVTS